MDEKKIEKKIMKVESDATQDKQQQEGERVADDVIYKYSNQFPKFMALTKEEKLAFFESLQAARENVMNSGNRIKERFGTVHDEYVKYFRSVEDNETSENFKVSSGTLECSGTYRSVSSSLQAGSSRSNYSAVPRRTMTQPVETVFVHMNVTTQSSTPSIVSSKIFQENKSFLKKEDENRESEPSAQGNQIQTKCAKRKQSRDDNSDKVTKKSISRFVTKLPKLKKKESSKCHEEERKLETFTSNKPEFETLMSDEKEVFSHSLEEARDSILKESLYKDNEILSMNDIMKKYEKPKEETPTKIKAPYRKETYIKRKANNQRVKLVTTSLESEKIKKEKISKRKERSRILGKERIERKKEKTKMETSGRVENFLDKESQDTEGKLLWSTDGLRKKLMLQDNSGTTVRKPKENKKEIVKTQKKGDSTKSFVESSQDKRNQKTGEISRQEEEEEEEEGRKVLIKSERRMIQNSNRKQDIKKILVSRKKIRKEKTEKPKKKGKRRKSDQIDQDRQFVIVKEKRQEGKVCEDVKIVSKLSGDDTAEAVGSPTVTTEIVKREAESMETFFFEDNFKHMEDIGDEEKVKVEETNKRKYQSENILTFKSFQNEFGEEVKCLEVESAGSKGATQTMRTTDEEIKTEMEEEISVTKTQLSVKSDMGHQPEQTELDIKRKRHAEKSESLILELTLEGEGSDNCYVRKGSSHVVTHDENSVLELWEELKLLKMSDSNCMMENESMTALNMGNKRTSKSQFTFLSNKTSQDLREKLIVVASENKAQEKGEGRQEAGALDFLKGEGVIVVDENAIEKIKILVKALEKEEETGGDTKLEVKPDKENPEHEYNRLLLEYIDHLTRLLRILTNKREQNLTRVLGPLTSAGSHPELLKNKKSYSAEKSRSLSNILPKTKIQIKAKEPIHLESEIKEELNSLTPFSDSSISASSCGEAISDTRKKLIEDFLREKANFVEDNIEGFRIIKVPSGGCELDTKVRDQETGQNKTKFKFFHIFSRFCKCVKKKGSEEDQVQRRQQQTGGKKEH